MALMFERRLAIPLWAIAVVTVALTAPPTATLFLMSPTTVFAIAAVGVAVIVFLMPGAIPWLRTARAPVRIRPSGQRDQPRGAITPAARIGVRTPEEPNRSTDDDVLDLVRMDDDGGWQMKRPLVIAVGLILGGQLASAQDMSRYRDYVLESSLESVVAAGGVRAADAKTLHVRPANIQELEWRAPYVDSRNAPADPVRDISFTFYNDALYQVVVRYDRDRTEGLTDSDIVGSLSTEYGVPSPASAKTRTGPVAEAFPDSIVVARWENPGSSLTLIRGSYTPDVRLILISKPLSARARSAVREAVRLDAIEAPRREAEQRKKEAGDASAARENTRTTNKAAFRP